MPQTGALTIDYASAVLQWYLENGVDEALMDNPVDRLAPKIITPETTALKSSPPLSEKKPIFSAPAKVMGTPEAKAEAERLAATAQTLEALHAALLTFEGLDIRKTAMNMVFASGNPKARVMVVGDAPETEDDRSGIPFSGEVGALTDKMFAAIGLSRTAEEAEKSIYLTNVLPWRPPGNRSPLPNEIEVALPFLLRHIALVKPQIVFAMGGVAAKALYQSEDTIGKLRGKWASLKAGEHEALLFASYHPSFLLKSQMKKKEAWEDLQALKARLETL